MQGIWIDGRRPASKKAIAAAVADNPDRVTVEATSLHGGEYNGPASGIRRGSKVYFVGPDPFRSRKFYGTILRDDQGRVRVK